RPGARRAGRLVRGRGAHRGRRLWRQIAAHPGRHAHRHHDDPGGPDRHGAHRDNEPDAVLGVRHHAARSADAAVARGSHASHGDPVLSLGGDAETARAAHHLRAALPVRGAMTARRADPTGLPVGRGWTGRVLVGASALLAVYPSARLAAQDSQFGIRGLGTPGRFETVRGRSTGGGLGAFDPLSPLTEASLGDLQQLAATATGGAWYRSADLAGVTTSLRAMRFPVMGLAGPVFGRLVISAGFTTYLDRTWDVRLRDSLLVRGAMRPYPDELARAGGGLRWAPSPSVRLAGTVTRRTWADAGPGAFNTVSWSAGLEVGAGFSPLRVGVRGGQLPFSTGPTAPTEVGFAAGTGRAFAHGRALVDVGLEHLRRTGAGLSERVWTFLFGFTVRP